jgi:hypothetical protein
MVVRVCFEGLVKHPEKPHKIKDWIALELALPESVQSLADYDTWRDAQSSAMAQHFDDVHDMLTEEPWLKQFLQLPFPLVAAWASSDDLLVDSENSVAVALDAWAEGPQGKDSSHDQLKQLSGLLRVKHLSPSKWEGCVTAYLLSTTLAALLGTSTDKV